MNVETSVVTGTIYSQLGAGFFTEAKPKVRDKAEDRSHNTARYVLGYGNFSLYGRYELGVAVSYSYEAGAQSSRSKRGAQPRLPD